MPNLGDESFSEARFLGNLFVSVLFCNFVPIISNSFMRNADLSCTRIKGYFLKQKSGSHYKES